MALCVTDRVSDAVADLVYEAVADCVALFVFDVGWHFVCEAVFGCVIDVDVDGCFDAVAEFVRK